MSHPSVAIVILNWNGRKFLKQFLPSVTASEYPNLRLVIADNASTDDSLSFLEQYYPSAEILINKNNEGFAKGYNTALKQVKADYYILLNSDVEVTRNWIQPVIDLMESDKTIAACQPKILSYHRKHEFEYAGASGGWIDMLGYPFARGRIFDVCEEDKGQYDEPCPVFWASGAAMFVRASVYHEMNGFDEFFFAHQEEIDLCWRMQLSGYKIYVQPASVVYHVGGGTLPKGNSLKVYLNYRNNMIMLVKNNTPAKNLWLIPMRFALNWAYALKSLLSGDSGYLKSVLKADVAFLRWLLAKKDTAFLPHKRGGKVNGYYRGSVVWQYFISGKKKFSLIVGIKK
jgi:hypothetical protein